MTICSLFYCEQLWLLYIYKRNIPFDIKFVWAIIDTYISNIVCSKLWVSCTSSGRLKQMWEVLNLKALSILNIWHITEFSCTHKQCQRSRSLVIWPKQIGLCFCACSLIDFWSVQYVWWFSQGCFIVTFLYSYILM